MPPNVTIVTGASSGIGAATARLLALNEHRVGLLARNSEKLSATLATLPDVLGGHVVIACDVSDAADVDKAFATIDDRLGLPTGLINAAGICHPAPIDEVTAQDWSLTMQTNLTGTFLMSRAFACRLRAANASGSIVNLGSEASAIGMPHYTAYCASKAGVIGLTRAMAAELAPHIRVNALCPGPVDTPMLRAELALTGDPAAAWGAEISRVPLRSIASAADIADAAVWLLSARNATGSVLSIDGGTTGAFYGVRNN